MSLVKEQPVLTQEDMFTGRAAELALIGNALAGRDAGRVFLVHGPGGIGKTALLQEMARLCQAPGRALYIDAGEHDARPESVLAALAPALVEAGSRTVLLLDGWDTMAVLDGWLRQTLVPKLPEHILLVLAQRSPPGESWRSIAGWGTKIRSLPLENLSDVESRRLLGRLGAPPARVEDALAFTRGQPLALRLVADALASAPDLDFEVGSSDVVQTLVRRFLELGAAAPQRALLEAASAVRSVTEPFIAALIPGQDAHELFRWLAGLPFVAASPTGLHLHDLARDVISADLRWRNPERWTEILERAYAYLGDFYGEAAGAATQRTGVEALFLSRHAPWLSAADWGTTGRPIVELAQPADHVALRALVAEKEGEESAEIAAEWMRRQPNAVYTYRDHRPNPAGISTILTLDSRARGTLAWDPGVTAAWRAMARLGALRPGETAIIGRHCFARDTYQLPSAYFIEHLALINRLQLTQPAIRYALFVVADPDYWAPRLIALDLPTLPEAQFTVGGRSYGMLANDFRRMTPLQFFRRSFGAMTKGEPITPSSRTPLERLERRQFLLAVRDALKDLQNLAQNPLVDSRLVWIHVDKDDRVARERVLRNLLLEVVRGIAEAEPALGAILQRTYLDRQPQKEVAFDLHLSWSSYRRALVRAVEALGDRLWQQEIG